MADSFINKSVVKDICAEVLNEQPLGWKHYDPQQDTGGLKELYNGQPVWIYATEDTWLRWPGEASQAIVVTTSGQYDERLRSEHRLRHFDPNPIAGREHRPTGPKSYSMAQMVVASSKFPRSIADTTFVILLIVVMLFILFRNRRDRNVS